MDSLPDELIELINSFLDPFERDLVRVVCKKWLGLIKRTNILTSRYTADKYNALIDKLSHEKNQISLIIAEPHPSLDATTIQQGLQRLNNVVSLTIDQRVEPISEWKDLTVLHSLTRLNIFCPSTDLIASLTNIKHMTILHSDLGTKIFTFSTAKITFETINVMNFGNNIDFNSQHTLLTRLKIDTFQFGGDWQFMTHLINLKDLHLTCTCASSKFSLDHPYLESLCLENVKIYAEHIAYHTNLTKLQIIGDDRYNSPQYENWTRLTELKVLKMAHLSRKIEFISALKSLEDVNINSSQETGSLLKLLDSDRITRLALPIYVAVDDNFERNLKLFTNLRALNLYFAIPFPFKNGLRISLPNLTSLKVSINSDGVDIKELTALKKLRFKLVFEPLARPLALSSTLEDLTISVDYPLVTTISDIKPLITPSISTLTNLRSLRLNWPYSPFDQNEISSLNNLTSLSVHASNGQQMVFWPWLATLTQLRSIDIPCVRTEDEIHSLTNLRNLTYLSVTEWLTDGATVFCLTNLRKLELENTEENFDRVSMLLKANLPFLQ